MKEEILKRAMFAMPLSKEAKSSGILAGFDLDEMEGMEDQEPSEDMPQMSRTPQNPEILMNNLRGDYRSVDARYMELAQMVGEEAAMETPPEVLAMLQMQLAAQPQGIGALPQGQGMMPPAQGPEMMPPGMEGGMPPFPQGGAEQAPPTPDGMPPLRAAAGAFVNPITRMAQYGADRMGALATQANILGGQLLTRGMPNQFPPIFENVRGPGGRFTAEQVMKYPTLSEHLANFAGPTLTQAAQRVAPMVPPAAMTGVGMLTASGLYKSMFGDKVDPERAALLKAYEDAYYQRMDKSIPMPSVDRLSNEQIQAEILKITGQQGTYAPAPDANREAQLELQREARRRGPIVIDAAGRPQLEMEKPEGAPTAPAAGAPAGAEGEAPPAAAGAPGSATEFIRQQIAQGRGETPTGRMERIKAAQKEYAPLYKELLGDTKEDMYRNAMLMLADAGFKYAALPAKSGTTPISLLATAAQGIPQGFMALLAQAKDRQLKVDTAALSQAVSDVQEQDKYAQQLKMELIKGDYRLLMERIKNGGGVVKDGGAGLLISETKNGSFLGNSIDPQNPTVQSAINSRWTLRDTDNPFVVNRGQAPTATETDKAERIKLTSTLRGLDNSLSTLDNLKGVYTQAYGPGAWFSDKVNNLLVPVLPTAVVRPDVNLTDAATRISTGMNSILKNLAAANDSGRVAVQEQEWARETARGVTDPTKFFADKELVAKQFASMEAMLRNSRQSVLTQLGYEGNDYVMNTPNTGTKSDPFSIPADPEEQKRMFTFLGSTIGKLQDPRASVYLRMPNGTVQSFNPTQLQGLIK
jgi:hypothetical protein